LLPVTNLDTEVRA